MAAMTADAVVIGAGPNGLVAANLLADAGWDVLVLEAQDEPGGAVRSAQVTAPGFANDLFSAFYPLAAASPWLRGLELERYGLRWRHSPVALAHVLPDDRCAVLSRDVATTAASLAEFAAGDGDAWQAEVARWAEVRDDLLAGLLTPFPPVRAGLGLLRTLGAGESLRFARLAAMTSLGLGSERFGGDGARLLLAGNALHTDLGPGQAGGALFGWLLCMLAQDVGFPAPEGGAAALTVALLRRLRERGGRVECGQPVGRVLTADTGAGLRAVGVATEGGDLVRARRAVLATVPAPTLYLRLLDPSQLPAGLVRDARRFRWDHATVKVDWALSAPIPWRNPAAAAAGTVHLDGDLAGLTTYSAQLDSGTLPADPFVVLGQMTTVDPTRSPAGTESAWAYTHVPRDLAWDADLVRGHADAIEQVVARHAPGFTGRIVARHVQGPPDLQRADENLLGGAINAGTAGLDQQLFLRPVPGLGRADTPVDRLYLAGASAHPGGGVHGAPGANAARAALARSGAAGAVYGSVIRRAYRLLYAARRA
jgi:phytoene dehydrogenase-like protein